MKYFSFSGIASRQEYWAVIVIGALAGIFLVPAFGAVALSDEGVTSTVFLVLLGLAVFYVQLAATARRARSAGINPWWAGLLFMPYVNFVVAIVIGCLKPAAPQAEVASDG